MSLIDLMMTDCVIMNKAKISDGEGGFDTEWTEGAQIKVAIVKDASLNARIAEKDGVTSTFTLTTKRDNALEFHDVIKRLKDGQTFRVTSDSTDSTSPSFSSLDMAVVTAERWDLT